MNTGGILQIQPFYDNREEWLALAGENDMGFEVIELSFPPALSESGLFEMYKSWYKSCDRVTSLHGRFIDVNPASGDPKFRELSRLRCRESCVIAKEIGAKNVIFHTGCAPFLSGEYIDYWSMVSATFYQELLKEYDLNIFIENSSDTDPEALYKLMELVPDERFGVCLDLGHVNYSKAPMEKWFEVLGQRIGYIHLSDNHGIFDDHRSIGKGNVDWVLADRLYRELEHDVIFTLEVGNIKRVRASLEFIKRNGFFDL